MRAYYFDNLPASGDQRLPHDCVPSRPVSTDVLEAHDNKFWHIPLEEYESKVDAIATERGYTNRELTDVSKEGFGEVCFILLKKMNHFVKFFNFIDRYTKRKLSRTSASTSVEILSFLTLPECTVNFQAYA
jgi:hypothetical protein